MSQFHMAAVTHNSCYVQYLNYMHNICNKTLYLKKVMLTCKQLQLHHILSELSTDINT